MTGGRRERSGRGGEGGSVAELEGAEFNQRRRSQGVNVLTWSHCAC